MVRVADCPDTTRCPSAPRLVFKIEGGEHNAATGNLFYSVVTNGIMYANHKGYVPWVSFQPSWVRHTMGTRWAANGSALWELFFE
eukprot:5912706-Prymnesium_polylepis.1